MARRNGTVIVRDGARGRTFALRYKDAAGERVFETLGREDEGWTERRANEALQERLVDVRREKLRKPDKLTFAAFAERFTTEYLPGRNLKPSSLLDYEGTIGLSDEEKGIPARHLTAYFGAMELAAIEPADIDAYIVAKTKTLSPKTISNQLGTLGVMFKVAKRWRLVPRNPLEEIDRPRVEQGEMQVLNEAEISRLLTAYRELEAEADPEQAPWWALARRVTTVALGTALRRGELLALRWRDVQLLERRLSVREAYVRGQFQSPKSRSSRRTIDLGPRMAAELDEHYQATSYTGDDELVFGHPLLGTPVDPSKLSRCYMRKALKRAGIEKPFRVWHDLRHTAITLEAAAGNPAAYVQLRAGHSQGSITERYIHAAQVLFPGAAERGRGAGLRVNGSTRGGTVKRPPGVEAPPDEALRLFYVLWEASQGATGLPRSDHFAVQLECGHPVPPLTIPPEERTDIPTHVYCEALRGGPEDEEFSKRCLLEEHVSPPGYVSFLFFDSMADEVTVPDALPKKFGQKFGQT